MNKVLDWAKTHPKLSMWAVLGIGMVAIIAYEARDVGLLAGQWAALIVATVLVAGLCVWIIGWEDDDEDETPAESTKAQTTGDAAGKDKKKKK
jgi:hypothetical protein